MELFDEMAFSELSKEPSMDFTAKVMQGLAIRPSRKNGYQFWGILAGLAVVFVLWGLEGFRVPSLTLAFDYFGLDKSFEVTGMLKGFMMVNALLVLLLIDRAVQRRKRVT